MILSRVCVSRAAHQLPQTYFFVNFVISSLSILYNFFLLSSIFVVGKVLEGNVLQISHKCRNSDALRVIKSI